MRLRYLTKERLISLLESTPQRFWPPRPTKQDKLTIVHALQRANEWSNAEEAKRLGKAIAREFENAKASKRVNH